MLQSVELELTELPAAPQLLVRLIDLFQRESVDFEELHGIISRDAALSARVLTVANSAAYRQWNDVLNLKEVMVVLGTRAIKSLALTSAVHQFFSSYQSALGSALHQLWFEALLGAHSSRRLAELLSFPAPAEAYLVGLMRGLGQLGLLLREGEGYRVLLRTAASGRELQLREQERFGVNSAELAARIFAHWRLNAVYEQSVRYQHGNARELEDMPLLVRIINTSARACFSSLRPDRGDRVDDQCFGLNQAVVDELLRESRGAVLSEAGAFGIDCRHAFEQEYELDDEGVQLELARRVHRIALVEGAQAELQASDGLAPCLASINRQLRWLFGVSRSLCFLLDDSGHQLVPMSPAPEDLRAPGHAIACVDGQNLVASSLVRRQLLSLSRDAAPQHGSVFDLELLMALGNDAMLCLPLVFEGSPLGVIVFDYARGGLATLDEQHGLLQHFAQVVSGALLQQRRRDEEQSRVQALQREAEQLARRALVHEVSSPLTLVSNYLEILNARNPAEEAPEERVLVQREIERISGLLVQFRDREPAMEESGKVDINGLVRQTVDLLRAAALDRRQISVELTLDGDTLFARAEAGALRQILTNLLNNAAEALTSGGHIEVATHALTVLDQRRYCELVVSDDGPGLSPEVLSNLFSPVSSSKGGRHQGLGLAIVYQLVKRLSGSIRYRVRDGGGAEFSVLLPLENSE